MVGNQHTIYRPMCVLAFYRIVEKKRGGKAGHCSWTVLRLPIPGLLGLGFARKRNDVGRAHTLVSRAPPEMIDVAVAVSRMVKQLEHSFMERVARQPSSN